MNQWQYNRVINYINKLSDEEIRELFKGTLFPKDLKAGDYIQYEVDKHLDSFHGIVKYIDGDNKVYISDGLYNKPFILDPSQHEILSTTPKLKVGDYCLTGEYNIQELKLLMLNVKTVSVETDKGKFITGDVEAVTLDSENEKCIVVNGLYYKNFCVEELKENGINHAYIEIGDYIEFYDGFYDTTQTGIVSDVFSNIYHINDDICYDADDDTLEKHIPKLKQGKWYYSGDFTESELQLLLPVGTKVSVKSMSSSFSEETGRITEIFTSRIYKQTRVKINDTRTYDWFMIPQEKTNDH